MIEQIGISHAAVHSGDGSEMTMNAAYARILDADSRDRQDLFVGAGQRLGTAPQNIEKDLWICWTPTSQGPRFQFKGGTSLSKGFGLIERFSEDIDITVFGEDASVEALKQMSGKKRPAKLDAIKGACHAFIAGDLLAQLSATLAASVPANGAKVELGSDDESASACSFGAQA